MKTVQSINPATEDVIQTYELWTPAKTETALAKAQNEFATWRRRAVFERASFAGRLSDVLERKKSELARLMTAEMGKTLKEANSEIEKCAFTCKYLAEHMPGWIASKSIPMPPLKSEVVFEPLGVLVGIMPWNFPFWQVIRFAVPAAIVGNTILLKHASNVFGCNQALEACFLEAGFPEGVFQAALLSSSQVLELIPDRRVKGVSLTGSTAAGRSVGRVAGESIKKLVLELGGSDAYVVLDDADLNLAVEKCVTSRLINGGQSCISAKRFIVTQKNVREFTSRFQDLMKTKSFGDPLDPKTDFGPMARKDLRDQLHEQVKSARAEGAECLMGGEIPDRKGAFYPPTVLINVKPEQEIFSEELFGPVASIIQADNEQHAIELANLSSYGLGGAVFSKDLDKAWRIARHEMAAGMCGINDFVRSDVRLPFGGVKDSGVGRELGELGVHEFANVKSITQA